MKIRPAFAISIFALCALGASAPAHAMDSTETLPASINSPAIRAGMVTGVDSKYLSDGTVRSLNDINTINFDIKKIAELESDIKTMSAILNQFSQQKLGNQINLGTLRVETEPNVRYLAPIYARGITENLTMAVAVPIVFYENKLAFTQSASNVEAICSQFVGLQDTIPDLKDACQKLSKRITDAAQELLAEKGYKPVKDRKETVMGDLQLVSLYRFHDNGTTSGMFRSTLTLPTGQKNDPDDLADLGVFGNTAIEPQILFNYIPWKPLRLAAKAGYKISIPDSQEMRVPSSDGDMVPGLETKHRVSRNIGDTLTLGTAANLAIWNSFAIAGGYEYVYKATDSYSGGRNYRYDLLAKDSRSTAHKLRAGITYDTIALYQRTKSVPPLKIEFEVSNTIAGTNSDRQLVNELSLTMFF